MLKADTKLYPFGPYLLMMNASQYLYHLDLNQLFELHDILGVAGQTLPKDYILKVDGRNCRGCSHLVYFASWNEFLLEFVDSGGSAFLLFLTGAPDEVIVCRLTTNYALEKMAAFAQLKSLHTMFNDTKIREHANTAKFLIKTIKPRG